MIGMNGQKVYLLIMEIITYDQKIAEVAEVNDDPKRKVDLDEFFHRLILIEIVDKFMVSTNKEAEKIFDAVSDAYHQPNGEGIEKFIKYRLALEKERGNDFRQILAILPKRKLLHQKINQ